MTWDVKFTIPAGDQCCKAYDLSGNQYHYQSPIKSNLLVLLIFLKKNLHYGLSQHT
jgi:hypothetical protein